jgi:DNA-binding HxlR family transcriptional regulator
MILSHDDQEVLNITKFIKILESPIMIKILRALDDKVLTFSYIHHSIVQLPTHSEKSNLASYYLKKLLKLRLVQKLDHSRYCLTFRGIKLVELCAAISKIANLTIDNPDNAMTKLIVNLNTNRNWLEPLLKTEIQKVVNEITQSNNELARREN